MIWDHSETKSTMSSPDEGDVPGNGGFAADRRISSCWSLYHARRIEFAHIGIRCVCKRTHPAAVLAALALSYLCDDLRTRRRAAAGA